VEVLKVIDNSELWSKQAEEMLKRTERSNVDDILVSSSEAAHFATSMLTALYGAESPQLKRFQAAALMPSFGLLGHARGPIKSANAELKAGLIARLRVAVAGEILAELLGLAKEVLEERSDAARNTSAVLVAAAFENLIRRMGEEFAGVTTRPKLHEVITALKDAGVLKGGQVATATSYLKFRNDSLHADWALVGRSQVESCLAFTESLLVKHF
jgi:hypothetical protein